MSFFLGVLQALPSIVPACVVTRTVQNCGAKLRLAAVYSIIQHSTYHSFSPSSYSTQVGIFVGGGRRNHIKFNLIKSSDTSALHLDSRGLSWQTEYCTPGTPLVYTDTRLAKIQQGVNLSLEPRVTAFEF